MKDQLDLEFESGEFHCPVCLQPFNGLDNLGVCGCSDEMILESGQTKLEDLMKLQAKLMQEIKGDQSSIFLFEGVKNLYIPQSMVGTE